MEPVSEVGTGSMLSEFKDLRIAVIFRADLAMPSGKAEVQFGHGIAGIVFEYHDACIHYMRWSQTKLSLEVDNEAALEAIIARAKRRGIPWTKVFDAGRTVFDRPTFTCIAVGPMGKTDCNSITRGARMR